MSTHSNSRRSVNRMFNRMRFTLIRETDKYLIYSDKRGKKVKIPIQQPDSSGRDRVEWNINSSR
jgi:hypothetical protein